MTYPLSNRIPLRSSKLIWPYRITEIHREIGCHAEVFRPS